MRVPLVLFTGLTLLLYPRAALAGGGDEPPPRSQAVREEEREAEEVPAVEEKVEVRADRPASEDVAAFATSLDTEEIASRGEDLADILARVPGARTREYGGLGQFSTLSLRASTAEQVTILVDGVPQNRALGGPVDLSYLPATQIEQVTVYRGFGPAVLGLGGIGGLVNIRTREPGSRPEGQVDLLGGELDTARISTGWTFRGGERSHHRIGAEWLQSQGDHVYLDTRQTPFNRDDDVERRRENNDVESGSLIWHGVWEGVGAGRLGANLRLQDRERGVAGPDTLAVAEARLDEELEAVNLSWNRPGEGTLQGLDLLLDGYHQEVRFRDPEAELGRRTDLSTRLDGGGVSGVAHLLAGYQRLVARLDVRREEADVTDDALEVSDRGGADRDLVALTLEDAILAGRWTVAPSLRGEWRRDRFRPGEDGTRLAADDEVSEDLWSGKVGAAFQMSDRCAVRGSAGTFFRSPSLLEMFGDRGFLAGNPNLRAESGEVAELGLGCGGRRQARPWSLELAAFGRDVDDLILFVPVSQGVAKAFNLAAARIVGVEGALTWQGPWGWSLEASGTLQDTSNESGGPTDGEPLVYQPDKLGYVGLAWARGPLSIRWDITYVGENSTDRLDTPALRLPSRSLHDLFVTYRTSRGLILSLDVRNVFDDRTLDVLRYPLPGRVVLGHVGWRWEAPGG
jgi:iron complex outermembrane receptor protein